MINKKFIGIGIGIFVLIIILLSLANVSTCLLKSSKERDRCYSQTAREKVDVSYCHKIDSIDSS